MDEPLQISAAFIASAALTILAVPLAIRVAARTDFYDRPGGYKEHSRATPYLGGVVLVLAFCVSAILFGDALSVWLVPGLCALALLAMGTVDDRIGLGVSPRLALEFAVAVAVWASGLGWEVFSSDVLNLAATILWVVALINAVNLMDNLDGAAATVSGICAAGIGVVALIGGDGTLAILCFSLAGACAGFLPHNLAGPARIFLGDGGSMPIGFILATLTMSAPFGMAAFPTLALACLLVALPLLDMGAVILSRRRRGVSILVGGRDHMTHRLFSQSGSERLVALVLVLSQATLCLVAIVLSTGVEDQASAVISILVLTVSAVALAAIEPLATLVSRGQFRLQEFDTESNPAKRSREHREPQTEPPEADRRRD